ncbi:polysaccharide deacetylase family protein [Alicyclobacillus suci]|uniref:polysaccharide deacetylase family protein n=1 Tax=Alicyclobacillus suci TaxID=2816080 RepID=UPI001A8E68C8|nr:polysaccharide deacetylase family protein [Alicyclobacillus suci]
MYRNNPVTQITIALLCVCVFTITSSISAKPVFAKQKVLYLTFDDGPGAMYTPQILNVLRQGHVHATFFVLGYRCREFPGVVQRIIQDGHEIGSHGYDHQNLARQPESVVKSEIRMADSAIVAVTGLNPLYYRPTYGSINRLEIPVIRRMGHPVVFWTVDSLDWKARSATTIVQNVERNAGPGSIVLFHGGKSKPSNSSSLACNYSILPGERICIPYSLSNTRHPS